MPSITHPMQHFSLSNMFDGLEKHDGTGGRTFMNLRLVHDTDAVAEEEQEPENVVESQQTCIKGYKMGISIQKTKLMTNSTNSRDVLTVSRQCLFKY